METNQLKEQMHKEFDERYKRKMLGETLGYDIAHQQDLKSFINSIIDRTVQMTEERIVGIIDSFYVYAREDGYFEQDPVHNQLIDIIKSIITNKSDLSSN